MSNRTKGIGCLILALLSAFTYGAYTYGTINCDKTVEPHRWILTGFFGLMWCFLAVAYLSEKEK